MIECVTCLHVSEFMELCRGSALRLVACCFGNRDIRVMVPGARSNRRRAPRTAAHA